MDVGRFRQECLNENWFLSLADAEENVDPGEDTTMGKGLTVRWATCPLGVCLRKNVLNDNRLHES